MSMKIRKKIRVPLYIGIGVVLTFGLGIITNNLPRISFIPPWMYVILGIVITVILILIEIKKADGHKIIPEQDMNLIRSELDSSVQEIKNRTTTEQLLKYDNDWHDKISQWLKAGNQFVNAVQENQILISIQEKKLIFELIEKIYPILLLKTYLASRPTLNRFYRFRESWKELIKLASYAYQAGNYSLSRSNLARKQKHSLDGKQKQFNADKMAFIIAQGNYLIQEWREASEWIDKINIDNLESEESKSTELKELIIDYWNLKGLIHRDPDKGEWEQAEKYLNNAREKAEHFFGKNNDKEAEISAYLAQINEEAAGGEKQKLKEAKKSYKDALEKVLVSSKPTPKLFIPKLICSESLARVSNELAELSVALGESPEAQTYSDEAQKSYKELLDIAEMYGNITCKYLALEWLTNTLKKLGRLKEAYNYGRKAVVIKEVRQEASTLQETVLNIADELIKTIK